MQGLHIFASISDFESQTILFWNILKSLPLYGDTYHITRFFLIYTLVISLFFICFFSLFLPLRAVDLVQSAGSAGMEPAFWPPPGWAGTKARWCSGQREAGSAFLSAWSAGGGRRTLPQHWEEGSAKPPSGLVQSNGADTKREYCLRNLDFS